jgi:CheY-like chemotaxis protein
MNDKSFESLESGRKTVLVVDDDPSILLVIQAMLESQDLRVLLANNAESALRLGEQSQLTIDLLLADVVMPDVSGPDLALRMLSMRPNLRVLFMSAFAEADIVPPPGPVWSGRSLRTALDHSSHLGWAEIRHPFHPLRGQRFEVLKKRRISGVDTLILRELERGSFSVAREWTDCRRPWRLPTAQDLQLPSQPPILS